MARPGKFKPKKAALRRVKITGTGKVKFRGVNKSHLMSKRSAKRVRQARRPNTLPRCEERRVRQTLGLE
jgi:large subunit ribosomal protein L35